MTDVRSKTGTSNLAGLRLILTAIVLSAVSFAAYSAFRQLERQPIDWSRVQLAWLAPALILQCAALHCGGWFWWLALSGLQRPVPLPAAWNAFFWSQLGKYIPGKAMVVVIRSTRAVAMGVPLGTAIASTFLETLMWLAVGSLIAVLGLWFYFPGFWELIGLALAMLLILAWATFPSVFAGLTNRLARLRKVAGDQTSARQAQAKTGSLPLKHYFSGWVILALGWLLVGLSYQCINWSFPHSERESFQLVPLMTAAALATTIGFITLIPGGLGVRELVLIPLLAPRIGIDQSLALAIIARLLSIVAELTAIGIWELVGRRRRWLQLEEPQSS